MDNNVDTLSDIVGIMQEPMVSLKTALASLKLTKARGGLAGSVGLRVFVRCCVCLLVRLVVFYRMAVTLRWMGF